MTISKWRWVVCGGSHKSPNESKNFFFFSGKQAYNNRIETKFCYCSSISFQILRPNIPMTNTKSTWFALVGWLPFPNLQMTSYLIANRKDGSITQKRRKRSSSLIIRGSLLLWSASVNIHIHFHGDGTQNHSARSYR